MVYGDSAFFFSLDLGIREISEISTGDVESKTSGIVVLLRNSFILFESFRVREVSAERTKKFSGKFIKLPQKFAGSNCSDDSVGIYMAFCTIPTFSCKIQSSCSSEIGGIVVGEGY